MDEYAPSCEACADIYQKRDPPQDPPCSTCKPALLPENEDSVNVYLLARNQVLTTSMGTVIDISFPAVKVAMDVLGVKDQKDCFFKVRHLFHEFKPREKS